MASGGGASCLTHSRYFFDHVSKIYLETITWDYLSPNFMINFCAWQQNFQITLFMIAFGWNN